MAPWIAAGVVALAVFSLVVLPMLRSRQAAKIGEDWLQSATSLGLVPHSTPDVVRAQLDAFDRISRASVAVALRGDLDGVIATLCLFRFTFRQGRGNATQSKNATGVLLDISAPVFTCSPRTESQQRSEGEQMMRQMMGAIMAEERVPVSFADDPDFDSRLNVTGPDHAAIQSYFNEERRRALPAPRWTTLRSNGTHVLWLREDHSAGVDELPGLIESSRALAAVLR